MNALLLILQVAVVFAIFAAAMWLLKRHGSGPRRLLRQDATVIARVPLAQGAAMTVVRVGEETFALGVTATNVTMLTPVTLPEATPDPDLEVTPTAAAGEAPPTREHTFWARFTTAMTSQGPVSASLVGACRQVARAARSARQPATTAAPTSFAAALATHTPPAEEPVVVPAESSEGTDPDAPRVSPEQLAADVTAALTETRPR